MHLRQMGEYGRYWEYAPPKITAASPMLVIAHGLLGVRRRALRVDIPRTPLPGPGRRPCQ